MVQEKRGGIKRKATFLCRKTVARRIKMGYIIGIVTQRLALRGQNLTITGGNEKCRKKFLPWSWPAP